MGKYTFGLDIGIASVGFAVMNQEDNSLVEFGTRKFDPALQASKSRTKRSARRNLRRKKWRLKQLKQAFYDFGILTDDDFNNIKLLELKRGYLEFTATKKNGLLDDSLIEIDDRSIYHLRKRALNEMVNNRELLLCIYNIVKTRGHFLMEEVDFSRGNIKFEQFEEKFYETVKPVVTFFDKKTFSKEVLIKIFEKELKQKEIKELLMVQYVDTSIDENANNKLMQIINLIQGFKCDFKKLGESYLLDDSDKQSFNTFDLKKRDSLTEFSQKLITIYDMAMIYRVLNKYNYICEKHVDQIDKVMDDYDCLNKDSEEYLNIKKDIQSLMKTKNHGNKLKVVKNINNVFPNGLYVKELEDILLKQKEFNDKITDEFIEVCKMITRARIPYYMGPLSPNAKNAWITRSEGKIKYSYEYALKNQGMFDEGKSVEDWKKRMISRCTYLPEEYALPKGSFTTDLFAIINEINVLKATSNIDDTYYLTKKDKYKIINNLFLKKEVITFDEVKNLLGLNYFGPKDNVRKTFNNKFDLYHQIIKIVPEYKIDQIESIFYDYSIVEQIDDIVFALNIYEDCLSKEKYFVEKGLSIQSASKLAKLNSKDFTTFSKKFIIDSPMDELGNSLLEKLFEDNSEKYTNEQMTLITHCNAYDKETGEIINYTGNKYEKLLNKNNSLGINLLLKDNNPYIPISRSVIRGLNETFKVFNALVDIYGIPDRVVVETAKDLKDSALTGEETGKHFDEMKKYYDYLLKECKDKKIKTDVDEWDAIKDFLLTNKKKVELYIRQNGRDLITGDKIIINDLKNYDIDHILPRGFGDNSMNNLMLISKTINSQKGDRLPIEFIRSNEVTKLSESKYIKRIDELLKMKLISEEKKRRLLLESQDEAFGFIQRNLVDTRYIIKEFTAALNAYIKKNYNSKTKIVSLQGGYNSIYRKTFKFNKNRHIGEQHHAHDAAIIIVVDKVLSYISPNYESRKSNQNDYKKLLVQVHKEETIEKNTKGYDSNEFFIRSIYQKAFKTNDGGHDFIDEVKKRIPLLSNKVDKKYTGKLFEATILDQSKRNKNSPLDILNVNNDQRIFSSVECVATDFYKVTDSKGNKKHYAIHIPKVIVDQNGVINKEKYISIVKEYYKAEELLKNGDINYNNFRLRMFKGDYMYDTNRNVLKIFNGGSIVNKKIDVLPVKMFSYYSIEKLNNNIINKYYKLNQQDKKDNKLLFELINEETKNLVSDKYYKHYCNKVNKKLETENFFKAVDFSSYLIKLMECNWLPPTIDDQLASTASSSEISRNPDAQYIKIVTTPLGIRSYYKNNRLIINGPNDFNKNNKFKIIKKEEFSWKI